MCYFAIGWQAACASYLFRSFQFWFSALELFQVACVSQGDERHAYLEISVCVRCVLFGAARRAASPITSSRGSVGSSCVQSGFPRKTGNGDDPNALPPGG